MNFKAAVLSVIEQAGPLTGTNKKAAARAKTEKHPLLWKALQAVVTHRIEKDTGEKVGADWTGFLDWLITNLPAILKLIMALFGA